MKTISEEILSSFRLYMISEEKSPHTVKKYLRDVRRFSAVLGSRELTKETALAYKEKLIADGYQTDSVNSMLAALNCFFRFENRPDCLLKALRTQKEIFCRDEKELTYEEYRRLIQAAGKNRQLQLIVETICSTGIRVSELRYFTVEAVRKGQITVTCKNKTRTILLPGPLVSRLLDFAQSRKISSGVLFRTRSGNPIDRSNIWGSMKNLCRKANVPESKVYPHNLRKLFARRFYDDQKDIAKLADILGHSSINTTRIYIVSTGSEHREIIDRLGLVI